MSIHSLEGKVVLIGGGAKNLGGLLARDFAENGAKTIIIHYHSESTKSSADKTIAEVKRLDAEAIAVQGDLTKPENVTKLFDEAISAFGGIDIAVNTTGMVLKKPFTDISESEYDTMFGINAKAAFFFYAGSRQKIK